MGVKVGVKPLPNQFVAMFLDLLYDPHPRLPLLIKGEGMIFILRLLSRWIEVVITNYLIPFHLADRVLGKG